MNDRIFEYIVIQQLPPIPGRKTHVFDVLNKRGGYQLGAIEWFPSWRQYVFYPNPNTVYSSGCLIDVAKFIAEINTEHKQQLAHARSVRDGQ